MLLPLPRKPAQSIAVRRRPIQRLSHPPLAPEQVIFSSESGLRLSEQEIACGGVPSQLRPGIVALPLLVMVQIDLHRGRQSPLMVDRRRAPAQGWRAPHVMVEVIVVARGAVVVDGGAKLHVISCATGGKRSVPVAAGDEVVILVFVARAFDGSRRARGRFATVLAVDLTARGVVAVVVVEVSALLFAAAVIFFFFEVIPAAVAGDDGVGGSVGDVAIFVRGRVARIRKGLVVFVVAFVIFLAALLGFGVLVLLSVLLPGLVGLARLWRGMMMQRELDLMMRRMLVHMMLGMFVRMILSMFVLRQESMLKTRVAHESLLVRHAGMLMTMCRYELVLLRWMIHMVMFHVVMSHVGRTMHRHLNALPAMHRWFEVWLAMKLLVSWKAITRHGVAVLA